MSIFVFEHIFIASRPIRRINAPLHQPMKRRMRPITHMPDQAMFERIDVNVIHVRTKTKFQWRLTPALSALNAVAVTKIRIIANQMFPITTLPYAPLAACHANLGASFGFW